MLLASAVAIAALRMANLSNPAVGTIGDIVVLVLASVLALVAAAWTAMVWRSRVALAPAGIEVRRIGRRFVPYAEITRAYRDRSTPGAVTLLLAEGRTLRLPAPLSGLGTSSAQVDEALEQIRARLPKT